MARSLATLRFCHASRFFLRLLSSAAELPEAEAGAGGASFGGEGLDGPAAGAGEDMAACVVRCCDARGAVVRVKVAMSFRW